jgi:hypothetical protein
MIGQPESSMITKTNQTAIEEHQNAINKLKQHALQRDEPAAYSAMA